MISDEELVERAQAGDRQAFKSLFLAHRARVARVLLRLLPACDVEDVTQEVFLHVHRSLASFRGDSRFSTWLYRLTLNIGRMHLRRSRSRPKLSLNGLLLPARLELIAAEDPREDAERTERVAALHRLLAQLSDKKREALILHDFEGLDAEQIAAIVGAPVMTVRTRVFYARRDLYAAMAHEPALRAALPQDRPSRRAQTRTGEPAPGSAAYVREKP